MEIRKATIDDKAVFSIWNSCCRIEECTCRPIENGRKAVDSSEVNILTITLEGCDEPVGKFLYFDHNPRNHSCEFGYAINPKYRGKGLGAEMISAGINYLLADPVLNLNKLYCQTAEFNIPSVRILEKLGLKKDGVLREHHELDGKLWNDFIFSILKTEWKGRIQDEIMDKKVILDLHSFQETLYQGMCGAASLLIVLDYYGIKKSEQELALLLNVDGELGTNSSNIKRAAESFGLQVEIKSEGSFEDIGYWLDKKAPVIVDWFTRGRSDYSESEIADGHYSVVAGLDGKFIYLQDTEIGRIREIAREDFMRVWFDFKGRYIKPEELIVRQLIAIYK